MANLDSLIRLHKHELDEQQKQLAELNSLATKIEQDIQNLEKQKEKETTAIQGDVFLSAALPNYLEKCKKQKDDLVLSLEFIEEKIDEMRNSIQEKFTELKKFELIDTKRKNEKEKTLLKKENEELDEIALDNYRRNEKD